MERQEIPNVIMPFTYLDFGMFDLRERQETRVGQGIRRYPDAPFFRRFARYRFGRGFAGIHMTTVKKPETGLPVKTDEHFRLVRIVCGEIDTEVGCGIIGPCRLSFVQTGPEFEPGFRLSFSITDDRSEIRRHMRTSVAIFHPAVKNCYDSMATDMEIRKHNQSYAVPLDGPSIVGMEELNQRESFRDRLTMQLMDATNFRALWELSLRQNKFGNGVYGGEARDRDGIAFPYVTFDTRIGAGIGRHITRPGVLCAAFSPEGTAAIATIQPMALPSILPVKPTTFSAELFNLRKFIGKHLNRGGRIVLTGVADTYGRAMIDAAETNLQFPGITVNHLLVEQEPVVKYEGVYNAPVIRRGIHTMFFFPGKSINRPDNHLIMVGGDMQVKPTGDDKWLRELFYPQKPA